MVISSEFVSREDIRNRKFGEVWHTLIPYVFKDVPEYYDVGNAVASLGTYPLWTRTFARVVHARMNDLPRGAKVLDVASGTHDIPLRLLAMNPGLEVHAVDGSSAMIAEGQRIAKERNFTIHAQVCDAHSLPFPDASFDVVTIQFASRHLEVIRAFSEIYRVLKPGGLFCHNDMLRPSSRIIEVPYLIFLRASVWCTSRLFGASKEARRCVGYFADAIHNFYTPEEMTALLYELGFTNVAKRSLLTGTMCYHIAQKSMKADRYLLELFADPVPEERATMR
ncbi:MAG: hypothetical protein UY70_C0012G0003 [Candidatus Kaiserbacteria bacterium GW2011_GWB1_52_6]|uniref:Methyltransferase type 11 n=3 Tax=Candidatus Kaiseribacteriota TaxID=1752734 RepID=A0A0G1ZT29_9BACT|nr:MAG: hypothetical protein UY67_C0010G0023 [Candidatus Kaiserbacteria bacterium GW2011_GWA2_52_12]KKW27531.1 MAG: hypothetical protein UY70_C0012G0003 [Candidatus Kaiserbacteria bacterium GW2011_GWB1_52_6]KKW31482.1 MAG: hypothetical protein UY74_C0013G0021 [Candidatus Kaiserbacteria bacterium GW2011_GWC2_52_8b]